MIITFLNNFLKHIYRFGSKNILLADLNVVFYLNHKPSASIHLDIFFTSVWKTASFFILLYSWVFLY